ncbi:MAG: flexitail domain-containing putative surface protein [Dehalococcoidia bacterium]
MHISRYSVRLVALIAVVAGILLALSTIGGETRQAAAAGNISGVSCADIFVDFPPLQAKGTAPGAEDPPVAKSITRVIDPGGAIPHAVTVVTITYLGFDGPGGQPSPIPDGQPADPCQVKDDGDGNWDTRIKYQQVNVNNRVAEPVTGSWNDTTNKLTFTTCTFSESLGTWTRTDVQSDINPAKDPLIKNFGNVTLYTNVTSPTIPADPTTCGTNGTLYVDIFPSVLRSISRNPTTDANPIVAPAVVDPDGTQAAPAGKIPVPQPADADILDDDWDGDGCTDHDELAPSNLDTLLAGRDPFNPNDCTGNLSGVYNILATQTPATKDGLGNLVPGTYFHCIALVNKAITTLTGSLVCYTDSPGLGGASGSAVPSHDDGLAGPPPPPPYTTGAPSALSGSMTGQSATITACFRNIGGVLKPNVIAVATINVKTGKGTVDIHANQPTAACNALVPVVVTGGIVLTGVPIQLARQESTFDHDQDGCTDAQELTAAATPKCGDDPYNPLDSDASLNSIASVLVTQTAADINAGTGAIIPGVYFHCIADLQQTAGTPKPLTTRLQCYVDNPALVVNPPSLGKVQNDTDGGPDNNDICGTTPLQPAAECGDGTAGSAPPAPFADIDLAHIQFTGTGNNVDNTTNLIHIEGCLSGVDNEALGGAADNVYVRTTIALHNGAMVANGGPTIATAMNAGQGLVDIWLAVPAGCAKPGGAPNVNDAAIEIAEQGTKSAVADAATWDTDKDGCSDKQELRNAQGMGGLRDPFNRWDFMDQYAGLPLAKDRIVSVSDIGAVVARFGQNGVPGDPDVTPTASNNYHTSADRNGALPGSNSWNLKGPDGIVSIGDVGSTVAQFGHSCTA